MLKLRVKSMFLAYLFFVFLIGVFTSFVVNFVQFCGSVASPALWSGDLAAIGKTAVKLIGVFPPASLITVWF